MKKYFITLWLLPLILHPFLGFAEINACMDCHQKQKTLKYLEHNYADWKKSIHAVHGVGCEACHMGKLGEMDPVKAHQGVLSSKDRNSSVYFQKVPETCGRCHTEEFKEFQKSAHYTMLKRTGKGPNCLTCHGAMATTVLALSDLDKTCSLCHGKPTRAAKALSLIHTLKDSLKSHPDEKFSKRYEAIQKKWHSFNVGSVIELSEELIKEIKKKK